MSFELPGLGTSSTDVLSTNSLPPVFAQNTLTTSLTGLAGASQSLLFVDGSVADYQQLVAGVTPGTEIHVLDPVLDAVTQITNTLLGRQNIASLHIVSHGEAGGLDFGSSQLNLGDLPGYASQLQSWGNALTNDADILLYGCNVAQGELGKTFVQSISQLTGADVAASDDLTGSSALGGNWTLEANTGSIESPLAFESGTLESYNSTLIIGSGSGYLAGSTTLQSIDLVSGASGVFNTGLTGDDPASVSIDLGNTSFRFFDQNYTGANQLFVNVNGLITFGSGFAANIQASYTNTDFTSGPTQAAIAPAWDDWLATGTGSVLYQFSDFNSDGISDQLIVEWSAVPHFSNPNSGNGTFQAILQLNTGSSNGNIIFNYPDLSILNTLVDEAGSATVAIKAAGTQGSSRLLISQNTTASPYVGTGRAVLLTGILPLLDLNGDQSQASSGIDYFTGFVSGGGPVSVVDSANLVLADPDSANLSSATITLTNRLDGAAEVLSALSTGTNISANYNSTTGVLTLSGADTVANYQQVLRTVTYNNTAASPNTANRVITFVVNDGANPSPVATSTVGINPPLLDLNGGAVSGINYTTFFPTGSPAVAIVDSANLTVTDQDNTNLSSANVAISNLRNGAFEVLAANITGTSITASYNSSTGVLTLSGSDTVANYQQVLRTVTYINTASSPDTRDRLITFTANDGTNNGPTATTTLIYGNRPNQAPTLTGNATLTAVIQNNANPSGSTLTSLFGSLFSDLDTDASLSGLAIVSNTATTQGRWEYSTDGTNWASVGAVADDATALALSATTLVRFVPVTGYNGTPPGLTVRALDNSYSNGFTNGTTRVTVNTTSNGGTTAISSGTPAALNTTVTQSLPNLLWRNSDTGENAVWQLNNFTLQTAYFLPTVTDPNWQIADTADFNSDGIADLLWRNKASGENVIWQMNSTGFETDHFITQVPDANWEIADTADFNSDGIADLLWRNKASGENVIWQMKSDFTLQSDHFITQVPDANWKIVSTDDFNGDGIADILWRNKASGENAIWQMKNDFTLQSGHFITQVPDANWQIAGTDDFNGDGIADILWRNKASGENVIWQMKNDFTLQSDHFITQVPDINWQIAGTDDFNGDGTPDILWRNKLTAKEDIWQMNGFSLVQGYQLVDVIDPNWSVRPFVAG